MGIQDYQSQILSFFKEKFIDEEEGDSKELVDHIRQRLMLIENREERKTLVASVLDEIHEIYLINKYKKLYSTNRVATSTHSPNVVEYLSYSFKQLT